MNSGTTTSSPARGALRAAALWVRVGFLACLPFAAGLLAAALGPAELRHPLSPLMATGILLIGVPLWFVVAEALAAALRHVISSRKLFVAVDALLGFGLLVLLYSLIVSTVLGASVCAVAAALVWWLVAVPTHRAYRAAAGRDRLDR